MSDKSDLGAFLSGFIIGGLVGAVVALLMAPQSGEETRAYIRDKSIELKDRAAETAAEAQARAQEAAKRGQEIYAEQVARIKKTKPAAEEAVEATAE